MAVKYYFPDMGVDALNGKAPYDKVVFANLSFVGNDLSRDVAMLDRLSEDIEHGICLIDTIKKSYKPSDKLSDEVVSYIAEFESVRSLFAQEGFADTIIEYGETALDVIKKIVKTLWEWLCKLWDGCVYIFRYMTNSRFRCAQQFRSIEDSIGKLAKYPELESAFKIKRVEGFLSTDDVRSVLNTLDGICNILVDLATKIDSDEIKNPTAWLFAKTKNLGIVDKDGSPYDSFKDMPFKNGTLGSLGWTAAETLALNAKCIEVAGNKSHVDKAQATLERSVKALRTEIANDGSSKRGRDLNEVQEELKRKNMVLSLIRNCMVIYTNRITGISKIMTSIADAIDDMEV